MAESVAVRSTPATKGFGLVLQKETTVILKLAVYYFCWSEPRRLLHLTDLTYALEVTISPGPSHG